MRGLGSTWSRRRRLITGGLAALVLIGGLGELARYLHHGGRTPGPPAGKERPGVYTNLGGGAHVKGKIAPGSPRPNILFIVSDDQRQQGTMQVMPKVRHLFGDQGTRFGNALVTTPVCCPSRTTMLSGLYAHNHDVTNNHTATRNFRIAQTLLPFLKQDGYRTSIFGKFLNNWDDLRLPPDFDDGYLGFNAKHQGEGDPVNIPDSEPFIGDKLDAYLRERDATDDKQPWFSLVAVRAPHAPFVPQDKYKDTDVGPLVPNPATRTGIEGKNPALGEPTSRILPASERRDPERTRDSQLRQLIGLDEMVGKTFRTLDDLDETRDTIAIYIGDNGFTWGEYGKVDKFLPYAPVVEVPFYMRWPGHLAAGATDNRLVANVDITPTLFDALGITPNYEVDGHSLLSDYSRKQLLLEQFGHSGFGPPPWRALRTRKSLFVHYTRNALGNERGKRRTFDELYDVPKDPWNAYNLLSGPFAKPGAARTAAGLRKSLNSIYKCAGDCP